MTYFVVNSHDETVDKYGFTRYDCGDALRANWRAEGYDEPGKATEMAHKFCTKEQESYGVVHLRTRFVYQPTVVRQDFDGH